MDTPLLWRIPFSHFSENVRWTLDYKRIAHHRKLLGGTTRSRLARDGARHAANLIPGRPALALIAASGARSFIQS
jgi:hypothetical protein